ncbi:SUMF1/EgtB/PvdO family nonheme iron enzyme [Mariniflexile litorale]|uniref:SUMF1/EgtB/PvdO family nonheme iron enzyme n=1 Tax=Mariniflexile litorale TaxID=3045158 RepID=A0AAU7EEV7_9FLAO|nr:SUMF1/EgtB/PvdO family nonheme iron enzyme [Mariniflexile sp. KMM 9835]MDQ8212284.1 SUMF1/EgtB/PvdO family nonheme iron enzyme [Mariniflexile sp. KMM 9835]
MARFVEISENKVIVGSSEEEIEDTMIFWKSKLVDESYVPRFRDWLLKEFPRHQLSLKAFKIAKYPVTNGEFKEFIAEMNIRPPESISLKLPEDHPAWGMNYNEVETFIDWKSLKDGRSYRLPTEFEWEYAAAGTEKLMYPFGSDFDSSKCNTVEANIGTTTSVYKYDNYPSNFGVCDLAGNVEEWTSSLYKPYPGGHFINDDIIENYGLNYPVLRGGSFALGGDLARCTRRHGPHPGPAFRYRGFRLAISN